MGACIDASQFQHAASLNDISVPNTLPITSKFSPAPASDALRRLAAALGRQAARAAFAAAASAPAEGEQP